MSQPGRRAVWGAVFLAFVGCQDPDDGIRATLALVSETPVASKDWEGILVEFGAPSAIPLLGDGWSFGETSPDGNAFRWAVGDAASFRFESDASGERLAWIECQPHRFPGAPAQVLEITHNGHVLPNVHLREGRGRYPLELALVEGKNTMEIRFRYARSPRDTGGDSRDNRDRRELAVAFYRFDVPPTGTPPVEGKPGPFAVVEPHSETPGVYLPEGGRLSYFLRVPDEARLTIDIGAHEPQRFLAPVGAKLRIRVRSADSDGAIDDLAEVRAPSGEVIGRELTLDSLAGERVEISLLAEAADLFVRPVLTYVAGSSHSESHPPVPEDLSVLLIVLDGASAGRMSTYGYEKPTTPEIDKLAAESVVFSSAVSQAVYTIASIGSVLTGQYPERHQSVSFADRLPASAVTLPGLLTLAGFATVGFSGNAVVSSTFGLDRGYEEFQLAREREDYSGHGDSVQQSFSNWLQENAARRFFAYVHFREPHFPYDPPPPYDTRFGTPGSGELFPEGLSEWEDVDIYNDAAARNEDVPAEVLSRIRALYDGNMAFADHLVGKILEELDSLGLRERTIVILTADHGEALFEHRFIGHNTQLYDESVRVPLMLRVPGMAPREVSQVVELIDLAPTILALVGSGEGTAVEEMQGRSLVPLLLGQSLPPRPAFSRTLWNKPRYSVQDRRDKFIWDSRTGAEELYDRSTDPKEQVNLSAGRNVASGYWRQEIFHWLREQEHLRAGAPQPEDALVPEDLGRYLGGVGYLQYMEGKQKKDD